MKLYRTSRGLIAEADSGEQRELDLALDDVFTAGDPIALVRESARTGRPTEVDDIRAPIGSQEIWAAGVTYIRSRTARMEESGGAGGSSFYGRVYTAKRPEVFFKSTPSRVVDPAGAIRIRSDSTWSVPEPELALAISSSGRIFGFTIGNDVSARDIEGENPLYLPQAKVYAGSCSIGPCILLSEEALPDSTEIVMRILRGGEGIFSGTISLDSMKRTADELVEWLFCDNVFPYGCYLLTGTGIVPPDDFALQSGDEVSINIEPIGSLTNSVA